MCNSGARFPDLSGLKNPSGMMWAFINFLTSRHNLHS